MKPLIIAMLIFMTGCSLLNNTIILKQYGLNRETLDMEVVGKWEISAPGSSFSKFTLPGGTIVEHDSRSKSVFYDAMMFGLSNTQFNLSNKEGK